MNTTGKHLETMLSIRHIDPQNDMNSVENAAVCALAEASPKALPVELVNFLEYVASYGDELSTTLAASMEQLQDIFLRTLHQSFKFADIELDSRLILSLNHEGKIVFESTNALREELAELLASSAALPALLKILGVQSALLRTIGDLQIITKAIENTDNDKILECQQAYRVCLKGSLSHFYNT